MKTRSAEALPQSDYFCRLQPVYGYKYLSIPDFIVTSSAHDEFVEIRQSLIAYSASGKA